MKKLLVVLMASFLSVSAGATSSANSKNKDVVFKAYTKDYRPQAIELKNKLVNIEKTVSKMIDDGKEEEINSYLESLLKGMGDLDNKIFKETLEMVNGYQGSVEEVNKKMALFGEFVAGVKDQLYALDDVDAYIIAAKLEVAYQFGLHSKPSEGLNTEDIQSLNAKVTLKSFKAKVFSDLIQNIPQLKVVITKLEDKAKEYPRVNQGYKVDCAVDSQVGQRVFKQNFDNKYMQERNILEINDVVKGAKFTAKFRGDGILSYLSANINGVTFDVENSNKSKEGNTTLHIKSNKDRIWFTCSNYSK